GEKWVLDQNNSWWAILPTGVLAQWQTGALQIATEHQLNRLVFDDPTLLFNAPLPLDTATQALLGPLPGDPGFWSTGDYSAGQGGVKWFRDRDNKWWAITPTGDLKKLTAGTLAASQVVQHLSTAVYANPNLLFSAPVTLDETTLLRLSQLQNELGLGA